MEKQAPNGLSSCLGCGGSVVAVLVSAFLAAALGSVFVVLFLVALVGAGFCVAQLFTPSASREEREVEEKSSNGMASGVVVGARGCAGIVVGCVLGALIGAGLTLWLTAAPGIDWTQDEMMEGLAFGGGCFGATLGALFGLVVGSRRW